ncbi:TetR/AcrR family transcriptional regulator [Rhizobium sp. BK251]|uniref:TetR/AcrR family transcriptional regulator n=1 Tax=Rhizobium sp. BK251 TaxID=2512125 RepID=UPI00104F2E9D|nr:TetR/AcrR family transcriptional regulator [Rhizobium sp. BK251]TCL69757.1 TetR family transcriptional regulator [Rhizobium sp. BK251]
MARPKEFDRDTALQAAIELFCEHGYEGTSTEQLLSAMKISRQSMYDTFGDKRSLYLAALDRYNTESVSRLVADLKRAAPPLKALEETLLAFADRPETAAGKGCLGVSAVCEFGRADGEVAGLTDKAGRILASALESILEAGRKSGDIGADVDIAEAVQFLGSSLSGMKVSARGGTPHETLRGIARMAIRSLR